MEPPSVSDSEAGTQIGHYQIISTLGRGGMGEVYLAQDTKLRRQVALKVLPLATSQDAVAQKRLMREAQSAATLDHPNICTIYEVGEAGGRSFIAMQYIQGQTLEERMTSKRLALNEAVDISLQIADALSAAHARDIIHRDIKPSNIVITERGQAKVLDFGLAKPSVKGLTSSAEAETISMMTSPGLILGTIPYMSPEQLRGERVDEGTDIFGFGVLLYEMLSGKRPFGHENAAETIGAILHANPPELTSIDAGVPKALAKVVDKCLAKDRSERYQNMDTVAADLMAVRSAPPGVDSTAVTQSTTTPATSTHSYLKPTLIAVVVISILAAVGLSLYRQRTRLTAGPIDSIAVLPFSNSSTDQNMEYLSDGVTENLINSLSKIPNLKVMSRNSVFHYKGKEVDAQRVGKELAVAAVLKGDVKQIGDELLINVELVSSGDNSHLWGQHYTRKSSDVIGMQNDIAREIIANLRLKLSGQQEAQLSKRPTDNAEAYKFYLKGRYVGQKDDLKSLNESIEYYRQAIELDPTFALAYSDIAQRYLSLGIYYDPPRDLMPKARAYANRALEIDNTLSDPHSILGFIALLYDWDWEKAKAELVNGSIVAPKNLEAFSCTAHLLESTGRASEAERTLHQALESDPLSIALKTELGCAGYYARRYDESIKDYRETLKLEGRNMNAYWGLARSLGQKKQYQEAIDELGHVQELYGETPPFVLGEMGYVYAMWGKRAEAQKVIRQLNEQSKNIFVDPYFVSIVFLGLDDRQQAFAWLEKAYEVKSTFMTAIFRDPKWDELRGDSRFKALVQRMGVGA